MWSSVFKSLPCTLRDGLVDNGLSDPEVLASAFGPDEGPEAFAKLASEVGYDGDNGGDLMVALVAASKSRTKRTPSRIAAVSDTEILVWSEKRARQETVVPAAAVEVMSTMKPPTGKAPPSRWPTRLDKRLAAAATQPARETAEAEERHRWMNEAKEVAIKAGLPLVARTMGTSYEGALGHSLAQGVRVTTLRKRVRDARKMSNFMQQHHGCAWPLHVGHMLDYVFTRAGEPCGPSVPIAMQSALYFFEKGGGVATKDMISKDPLLTNVLLDLLRGLRSSRPMSLPAPREPLMLVAARERVIMDATQTNYKRAYSWWKNLQVWASLRFSDHRGLSAASLRITGGALRGCLTETKTTGKDKKISHRAFVVSCNSFLEEAGWLAKGLEIWNKLGPREGYFLAMPTEDQSGIVPLEVDYMAGAAMSRALHRELVCSPDDDGEEVCLVAVHASSFWREHSGRHNMPSWVAALLDVPEEWISHLGGWAISGTAIRYVATVEKRIVKMQDQVSEKLRAARGQGDAIDEEGLLSDLGKHMLTMGCEEKDAEEQIEKLMWFGAATPPEPAVDNIAFEDDGFGSAGEDFERIQEEVAIADDKIEELSVPKVREEMRCSLPKELLGKYAVSISAKTSWRCLHLLGACHRIPGMHYAEFAIFDERPNEDEYHSHCQACWRTTSTKTEETESEASSSTDAEM